MLAAAEQTLRDADERTYATAIAANATLVWFTDGLTEATRDLDEGYRLLREAIAQPDFAAAEHPARDVVDRVLGSGHVHDDIAVLVAAFG